MKAVDALALGAYFAVGVPTWVFQDEINALGRSEASPPPAAEDRPVLPASRMYLDCELRGQVEGVVVRREPNWGSERDKAAGRPTKTVVDVEVRDGIGFGRCVEHLCYAVSKKHPSDEAVIARVYGIGDDGRVELCKTDSATGIAERGLIH